MILHMLLLISWNIFGLSSGQTCVQLASGNSIPWMDDNSASLPNGAQVIVPSYMFTCCGSITRWRAWLQPGGMNHERGIYNINFQVWRSSATAEVDGCYSMVGTNNFNGVQLQLEGLVDVRVPRTSYITVEPGDVVGYRVYSNRVEQRGNGPDLQGIQLDVNSPYNRNDVWYHSNPQAQTSPSCPYPIGTNWVLSNRMKATPKLQVNIDSYSCPVSTPSVPTSTTFMPTTSTTFMPTTSKLTTSVSTTPKLTSSVSGPNTVSTMLRTSSTSNISVTGDTLEGSKLNESTSVTNTRTLQIGTIVGTLISAILLLTMLISCVVIIVVYVTRRSKRKVNFNHFTRVLEGSLEPNSAYESSASSFPNVLEQQEMNAMTTMFCRHLGTSEVETNIDASNADPNTSSVEPRAKSPTPDILTKNLRDSVHMSSNICYESETTPTDSIQVDHNACYDAQVNNVHCMSSNICHDKEKTPLDDDAIRVNPNTCYEAEISQTTEMSANSDVCYNPESKPAQNICASSNVYYQPAAPVDEPCYELCKSTATAEAIDVGLNVCYEAEGRSTDAVHPSPNICYQRDNIPMAAHQTTSGTTSTHKALPNILSRLKSPTMSTVTLTNNTTNTTQNGRYIARESIEASYKYEPVQCPD